MAKGIEGRQIFGGYDDRQKFPSLLKVEINNTGFHITA
jgi:hypothetical protein